MPRTPAGPSPWIVSLTFVLAAASASDALEATREPSQYVIRRWGVQSLRSNTVFALLQTRDRYIWLGTTTGLVRYDGERFVIFDGLNTPEFGDGGAASLAEGPDGSLFVGTTAGLVLRYKDGKFSQPLLPSLRGSISSLLAARDGSLWIGSYSKVVQRWRAGKAAPVGIESQLPLAMLQDEAGAIWIGTKNRGLIRYAGQPPAQALPYTDEVVQAMHVDRAGTLWIGTPHGLLRVQEGRVTRLTPADGLSHENITAVLEDRNGSLWVGTGGGGLNRLTGGTWSRLAAAFDGISDDDVRTLAEDHEGNLWVGTADGLNCLSEGPFVTFARAQGMNDVAVTAVAPGSMGSVWVGTASGQLLRLRGGKETERTSLAAGRGRDAVLAIREMRDGSVWVVLDSQRVLRFHKGTLVEQRVEDSARVGALYEDDGGPIILAEKRGFARLVNRRLVPLFPESAEDAPAKPLRYPHMGLRDSHGDVWLAHRFGVSRLHDGSWTEFGAKSGILGERVRWMSEDPEGGVWAATMGGLAYIKDDKVRTITRQHGLPENYLRLVLDDGLGHLWLASAGHIFRLDKRQVLDVFAGKASSVSPRVFDTSDGLRTTEILVSNNPGFRAADGRLWFATSKGVAVVNPARVSRDLPPPVVRLQELRINDQEFATDRAVSVPPGQGDLVIRYAGLSYATPERLQFRYQLEGYVDAGFVAAENRRVAYYTKIPPGHYRFRVMARNGEGPWSTADTSLDVYLAPHFYQTRWFGPVGALGVVLAVLGVHLLRVRKLEASRQELTARVEDSLAQLKVLRGLLPTCASCKKIRDEGGSWSHMESFITARSEANFSHSVCPECMAKLYPDAYADLT